MSLPVRAGAVLLLTMAQLVFRLAAPDEDWANFVSVVLQAAILGAAMLAARVSRWPARLLWGLIVLVVAVSAAALVDPRTEVGHFLLLTAGLVVLAPAMIVFGALRSLRARRAITLDLMFGVLSIYLLLGYAFSLVFQAIGDLGSAEFFANGASESPSNFLYFSFVTMTTVGYGDLASAEGVGRAFAIALALIGQIYLVTVVAIIVSSLATKAASD
ncbi:MAG TPA: potassium channel family protein [Gaiellaceae bacterium]|nr:potassium channel family protein [Gaiellaceae bacterium]